VAFLYPSKPGIIVAFMLFGLFQATTEGIGKAFVTDVVPKSEYGQALGFFHFLTGVAVLLSSLLAGLLWDYVSPDGPFLQGAIFGLLGLAGMALLIREKTTETTRAG
jgi:MFS family permease